MRLRKDSNKRYLNFGDKGNKASRAIAQGIVGLLSCIPSESELSGQTAGNLFEQITKDFVEQAFDILQHLRPGKWQYSIESPISEFDQYEHLAELERISKEKTELASALGADYTIKPDIVIGRSPVSDEEVNQKETVLTSSDSVACWTPLRQANSSRPILHASISCKWTLRSDRAQNARAEALNLIRNRKGNLPHVVAVTAEPLPTRIAALALGTGDLDCVYHFALPELRQTVEQLEKEGQLDMLNILLDGRRLRDISDLLFDFAI